jgi:Peptidase family M1 domain
VSRLVLFAVCCSCFAAGPSAADLARSIRDAGLDPDQCYRVRDLSFQKEDIKIYLTEGYLIFSKPVEGERRAAIFTAEVEGGDGEVILLPPYRGERQSLAFFTKSANLDEHFQAALMIFTDGARSLLDRIQNEGAGKKAVEMGTALAERWNPVLTNVQSGFEMRMLLDLLGPRQEGGMLFMALNGKQAGNFDMIYDPRSREQIVAGQLAERNGRLTYNVWTSFSSRSSRNGTTHQPAAWFSLSDYRIDATLDNDLAMKAVTRVKLRVGTRAMRGFPFDISRAMHVTSAKIDGVPAEVFAQESVRGRALRGNDNDVFLVVAPQPLSPESAHEFEFEHEGTVIVPAGNNVFFVGARASWYPRFYENFSTYNLTFHYPKRFTMLAAGDVTSDRTEGETHVTEWRTPVPIRMAGFNLGDYDKIVGNVPGFHVEVFGNKTVETALVPKTRAPIVLPPLTQGTKNPSTSRASMDHSVQAPLTPDPRARLHEVAADVSSSLDFFSSAFGPPALKTLTVSPIPGTFGQGFPGLVYLSTLAYLDPAQRPASLRGEEHQAFFSDLIVPHEVAHQWWGNVVTTDAYQDEWMLEALASYSALMWLERKKGPKSVENVLENYRDHLEAKGEDGRTVESAGPIIWGTRLDSTGIGDAWRVITYEKGAWIFHMLRRRLGDERFMKMLAELRSRYQFRSISTDDFRALAKEFLPPKTPADSIDGFFENWVYSTGVPQLKLKYSVKGAAPAQKVSGTITQSGVEDDFSVEVPVEIQFAKGAPQTIWVRTSNEGATFTANVRQTPVRVVLPGTVLARR